MANPLLEVNEIAKHFGGVWAVGGASFACQSGTIHGLIGPNGAGKTSTLNCVSGVYYPDQGSVLLEGRDISRLPMHRRFPLGVARTFQTPQVCRTLTVVDNIALGAFPELPSGIVQSLLGRAFYNRPLQDISDEVWRLLKFLHMEETAEELAGNLAYGLQKRLEIARALVRHPKVLLMDEPATGLNPEEIGALNRIIRDIAASGIAVLLVEHNMKLVMDICNEITVLNFGKVIARGTPEEIRKHPEVIEAYLGGTGNVHVAD